MQQLYTKSDTKLYILLSLKCADTVYILFKYYTIVDAKFAVIIFSNIHHDCCIRTDGPSFCYSTPQMHFQPGADESDTAVKVIRYSAVFLHKLWAPWVCLTLRSYAVGTWLTLNMKGEKNLINQSGWTAHYQSRNYRIVFVCMRGRHVHIKVPVCKTGPDSSFLLWLKVNILSINTLMKVCTHSTISNLIFLPLQRSFLII